MAQRVPHTGAPGHLYSLTEWRAVLEMASLPLAWPLLATAAHGDGHPVLLLPGFMARESTMVALRVFLKGRSYDVQAWGLGRNVGFQRRHADALVKKIRFLHHKTGRRVSLVGWSLGGVFALYGAHQASDCVRQVITLGSPVSVDPAGSQTAPLVKALYRMIAHPMGPQVHTMQPRAREMRQGLLPPVPISCLYSVSDGVVPPQEATLDGDDRSVENIRVFGSHVGLGFNPMVLGVVANRLAQPEGDWKPFRPDGWAGAVYRAMTHAAVPL
ncbi:MAG: esterase/lipase family protein [Aquabacterium sp.]